MRISDWSSDVCSSDLRRRRLMSAVPVHHVSDRGTTGRRVDPKAKGALRGYPPLEGVGRDVQRRERSGKLPPPSFMIPFHGAIVHFSRVGLDARTSVV